MDPYIIRTINDVITDQVCTNDQNSTTTPITDTPTIDIPATDTPSTTDTACLYSSGVGDGLSLISRQNLCKGASGSEEPALLNSFSLTLQSNRNLVAFWSWKCKSTFGGPDTYENCSATCAPGLTYCTDTQVCSASCGGDKCSLVDGIQSQDDPIWVLTGCATPSIALSVTFDKPYADQTTSKCFVSWTTTTTPPALDDVNHTTCMLDGGQVPNNDSAREVLVGQHSLTCQTVVKGDDFPANPNAIVSSDPVTKNFKCSRVPVSGEN